MSDKNNNQRIGAKSNAQVGQDFEQTAQVHFARQGISLAKNHSASLGIDAQQKTHKFDLGSDHPKVIVECKAHAWTIGDNVPNAEYESEFLEDLVM